jgi:two-component sensor histidine kinase
VPADFDLRKSKSLGLHLVDSLVNQIGGQFEMRRDGVSTFVISFGGS